MSKKQLAELAEQIYLEGFSEGCASMHKDYHQLKELIKMQDEYIEICHRCCGNPHWTEAAVLEVKINELKSKIS